MGNGDRALSLNEASIRPASVGLIVKIVAVTVVLAGAIFTAAYGLANRDGEIDLLKVRVESLEAREAAVEAALQTVRESSAAGTVAVAQLSTVTERLAVAVSGLQQNVAAQTAEIRNLKNTIDRLQERVDALRDGR